MLTALSSNATILLSVILRFFVVPIVLKAIGRELYGIWQIALNLNTYARLGDFNFVGPLKIFLATRQGSSDLQEKRRLLGAAVWFWFVVLPIPVAIGLALLWLLPRFFAVPAQHLGVVRWAFGISIATICLGGIMGIPGAVLKAHNRAYLGQWLQVPFQLLSPIGVILLMRFGFGLIGLAANDLFWAVSVCLTLWFAQWRVFPQLYPMKPEKADKRKITSSTVAFSVGELLYRVESSFVVLAVGRLLSPSAVPVFTITAAFLLQTETLLSNTFGGAIYYGIADLFGRGDHARGMKFWGMALRWHAIMLGAAALSYYLFAEGLIRLWVGAELFGGERAVLAIVLCAIGHFFMVNVITVAQSIEAITDITYARAVLVAVALALVVPLFRSLGLAGVPLSLGFAECISYGVFLPILIYRKNRLVGGLLARNAWFLLRLAASAAAAIIGLHFLQGWLHVNGWLQLFLVAGVSFVLFFLGLVLLCSQRDDVLWLKEEIVSRLGNGVRNRIGV